MKLKALLLFTEPPMFKPLKGLLAGLFIGICCWPNWGPDIAPPKAPKLLVAG